MLRVGKLLKNIAIAGMMYIAQTGRAMKVRMHKWKWLFIYYQKRNGLIKASTKYNEFIDA